MSFSKWTLLVLPALLVGCRSEGGALVVHDVAEYDRLLLEVQEATVEPFRAVRDSFPLSDQEKQNLYDADKKITALIDFSPTKYSLHVLRGMTRSALGEKTQAIEAFEQALALAPAEPKGNDKIVVSQVFTQLATIAFDTGDFEMSRKYADEALKLTPDDPEALTNLASTQVELKQVAEARKNLKKALQSDPGFARAQALLKFIGDA